MTLFGFINCFRGNNTEKKNPECLRVGLEGGFPFKFKKYKSCFVKYWY